MKSTAKHFCSVFEDVRIRDFKHMDDEWAPILITLQRIPQSMSEAKFQICYSLYWVALDKKTYAQPVFYHTPLSFLEGIALEFCWLNCHCHKCTATSSQHEQCILIFHVTMKEDESAFKIMAFLSFTLQKKSCRVLWIFCTKGYCSHSFREKI